MAQKKVTPTAETVTEEIVATNNEEPISPATSEETSTPVPKKAGKRSAKSLKEAEAETLRKERAASNEEATKPKQTANPTRSKRARQGKGIQASAKLIDTDKLYTPEEAIALAKKTSHVKFDATVELHVNLFVDPRHADQNVRDTFVLPAGTGRTLRVTVLTDDPAGALAAGADAAGNEAILSQLDKGTIDFDILIATPNLMAKLGKYARTLGPRGLMPNPKSGTVTTDVVKAVSEAKAGRVEYRVDSTGIIHLGMGKVSFSEADLLANFTAVIASIKNAKPASIKGNYFKAMHLATTMGPSLKVDLSSVN